MEEASTRGVVGLDTETDGLDAMRARLVGFSLATAPGRACYVPLRHTAPAEQVTLADAIAVLSPLLTDPCALKVLQNAKFDMQVLRREGFSRRRRRSTTRC